MSKAVSIYKKKYEATKARLSSALKRAGTAASNTKALGIGAAAGGAAQFAVDFAADKVDFIKENWWGNGATIGALALVVRKKSKEAALGLAGAAGYALAMDHKRHKGDDAIDRPWVGQGGGDTTGYDHSIYG